MVGVSAGAALGFSVTAKRAQAWASTGSDFFDPKMATR
jgi:hypothetical protein